MSVNINNKSLNGMSHNGNIVKKWIHNGIEVWRAIDPIVLTFSCNWLQDAGSAVIPCNTPAIPNEYKEYFSVNGIVITAKKRIRVSAPATRISCIGGSDGGGYHYIYANGNGKQVYLGRAYSYKGSESIANSNINPFEFIIEPGNNFYLSSTYGGGSRSWLYLGINITITPL